MKRFINAVDFRERDIAYVEFDETRPKEIGTVVKLDGTRYLAHNDVDYKFAELCVARGWWKEAQEEPVNE
jgi:hypothetical protein